MRLPRRRVEAWLEALEKARIVAERFLERFGPVTVLLHGSYARGDFNSWSDVDIVLVSRVFRGVRPLDRYSLVADIIEPSVEPVLLTPEEFERIVAKPSWIHAFRRGVVVVRDDYHVARLLAERGVEAKNYGDVKDKVRKLLDIAVSL